AGRAPRDRGGGLAAGRPGGARGARRSGGRRRGADRGDPGPARAARFFGAGGAGRAVGRDGPLQPLRGAPPGAPGGGRRRGRPPGPGRRPLRAGAAGPRAPAAAGGHGPRDVRGAARAPPGPRRQGGPRGAARARSGGGRGAAAGVRPAHADGEAGDRGPSRGAGRGAARAGRELLRPRSPLPAHDPGGERARPAARAVGAGRRAVSVFDGGRAGPPSGRGRGGGDVPRGARAGGGRAPEIPGGAARGAAGGGRIARGGAGAMSGSGASPDAIAIVGLAGRFPGAADIDELWRNLCDGRESITFFNDAELAAAGVPRELSDRPDYVRAAGVLDDVELFDAGLFGLTPREAELMDPQQRLFLECCWQACEHAGYDTLSYPGRIGVYGGSGSASYFVFNVLPNIDLATDWVQVKLFNDKDFLTTQTSFRLNLRGPSVAVQTACSTALVAIHLASQAVLEGECDMALAGASTVNFPHRAGYVFQE